MKHLLALAAAAFIVCAPSISAQDQEDSIRKKIRSAVTDSGDTPEGEVSPGIGNLLTILTACGRGDESDQMREDYFAGTLRYVDLKDKTADAIVGLTTEMRERRADVLRQETALDDRIFHMADQARAMAGETLELVREAAGLQMRPK